MKKGFLILFTIPIIVYAGEVKKEYTFNTPVIRNGVVCCNGCRTSRDAFAPSVAVMPVRLLLPYGQKAVSFTVTYDEPAVLEGEYTIKPFRPGGRISVGPPRDYYTRKSTVYDKDEFYPYSVRSEKFTTYYKNGHSIFTGILNPVQYNPVSRKIRYHKKISVTVTTGFTQAPVYKCTPFIKDLLRHLVDNPKAVSSLPIIKRGADDYEYLIVTTDALKNYFGNFIAFNKRRCLRTKVQTIQYIQSNVSGTDDAEKLRNYIKDQYLNYNIVYVLLGGDDDNTNANDIPHRGMRAQFYDYGTIFYDDKDIAADMYYSCLDGTWKNAGSSYYGEYGCEDIGWEVYASRFCVDDVTELNAIINKTIKYSEQPVVNEVENVLLAGEYLWGPPSHPVECWGKHLMEQLIGTCTANFYTTSGLGNNWNFSKLYEKDANWSKSTLINTVNNDKITWINHIGHANNSYVLKNYVSDVTNTNYTNNGTNANYFLIYTQTCYSGSFDNRSPNGSYIQDCIGEQFTSGISNGAIAYVGCSRYSLSDDGTASTDGTDGSNQRFHRYFHDAIFNRKIHYLEMMNAYSKEVNADLICESDITKPPYFGQMKYAAYNLNVLGDPALSVWTATPSTLDPDYDTVLTLPVFSVQTPPYSWIALLADDSIICTRFTDSSGNCIIDDAVLETYVTENPQGLLKVNIKAHNYLPFQGNLHIHYGTAIMLISPNGGELWGRGNTYDIDWRENVGGNIKIELLKGGAFHSIITNSTSNTSPYSWSIPDTVAIGSDYRIKTTSIDSPSISDVSNGDFTLTDPILTLIYPNGGEILYIDSLANITWNSIATQGDVKILYTTDGGTNWHTVISSTENDGVHPWTVANVVSSNCKIQISEANDGNPIDESDAVFSIEPAPVVTVTSPNGGEKLISGTFHTITWTNIGTVGNVKIEYSINNGSKWIEIVSSTANDGIHPWTVPDVASINCKIRISEASDGNPVDTSDNLFTIEPPPAITVTSPNGGEILYNGTSYTITWTSEGTVGDITIRYSPDNGSNWYTVISSTANDGIHPWIVPDVISINCKVQISEVIDGDPIDESDSLFTIVPQPTLTVTSPNGGETLFAKTLHDITWKATGTVGNIKIEYTADNGANWAIVEGDTPNDGLHSWTVPVTLSSLCKIRISEASDGNPFDESDNIFTIDDSTSVEDFSQHNIVSLIKHFAAIPNPVIRGQSVTFCFTPAANIESAKLKVYDPVGNLVFEECKDILYGLKIGENYNLTEWDLKNNSGRIIESGTYLAVVMITSEDGEMVVLMTEVGIKDNH